MCVPEGTQIVSEGTLIVSEGTTDMSEGTLIVSEVTMCLAVDSTVSGLKAPAASWELTVFGSELCV